LIAKTNLFGSSGATPSPQATQLLEDQLNIESAPEEPILDALGAHPQTHEVIGQRNLAGITHPKV
jgi:hypothetical protein